MTIYEVEAQFKLGPIELGEKMGQEVEPGRQIILKDSNFNPATRSATIVTVQTPDSVLIEWYSGTRVQAGHIEEGAMINNQVELKGKLRWVPTK